MKKNRWSRFPAATFVARFCNRPLIRGQATGSYGTHLFKGPDLQLGNRLSQKLCFDFGILQNEAGASLSLRAE